MTTKGAPKFQQAHPLLASLDIEATIRFYCDRLGFESVATFRDHAVLERDGVRIHFWLTDDPAIPKVTGCRVDVTGIDELAREMAEAGVVHPNGALKQRSWGLRELVVLDGDGNSITFSQAISPAASG